TFAAGVCSATIASTGSLVGVLESASFDVGVGFLPGGSGDGPVCPTGGAGLGIPAAINKEEQLAGAVRMEYAGRPESTVAFSAGCGYLPVRKSAARGGLTGETAEIQSGGGPLDVTRPEDFGGVCLPGADQEMAEAIASIVTTA